MLSVLHIRNLALVDRLTWELGNGLVGVTGETGAGKSIIVGALKLALGERADRSLVRSGAESCTVEALFDLPDTRDVDRILGEAGLDPCEDGQLVVRRIVSAVGGNRQFANGSPVTLAVLRRLGDYLVDLHGPHEHQSLISQERQLQMLDAFAGHGELVTAYRSAYARWRSLCRELQELRDSEGVSEQELELLRFQVREIREADPRPEEAAQLEQRFRVLSNHTRLLQCAQQLVQILSESEHSVLSQLQEGQRVLRDLERIDPEARSFTQGFDSAQVELEDLCASLSDYVDGLEFDPGELADVERRLDVLAGLKRKYGGALEAVLDHAAEAERRLQRVEGRGDALEKLEEQLQAAAAAAREAGEELSRSRSAAAPRLAARIAGELATLGFRQARFEIQLEPVENPGPHGLETAEFVFAPNPGEPEHPLRLIASSGEMSRVMLAVKSALADEDQIPLLVFDEIDANVGGEIARAVGARMADLGRTHQVIAITHLPQVASQAARHYVVRKEVSEGRTRSLLAEVEGDERVAEIARMLGGDSASARAHAASLLAPAS